MQPRESYLGWFVLLGAVAAMALVSAYPALIIAAVVLVCVAAVLMIIYSVFWLIRNQVSPITRVQATVLRRRMNDWDISLIRPPISLQGRDRKAVWKAWSWHLARKRDVEVDIASGKDFVVTFQVGRCEMEFSVPEEDYIRAAEGSSGLLVYRGEQFMHYILGVV